MGPSDYEWVPYSVTIGSAWAHEGERIGSLKSVELGPTLSGVRDPFQASLSC